MYAQLFLNIFSPMNHGFIIHNTCNPPLSNNRVDPVTSCSSLVASPLPPPSDPTRRRIGEDPTSGRNLAPDLALHLHHTHPATLPLSKVFKIFYS